MSKILDALDKLARQNYAPGWNNPAIRKFVETGDDELAERHSLPSRLVDGRTHRRPS